MRPAGHDRMYTESQLLQFYARFNEAYFGNTLPLPVEIAYVEQLPRACPDAVACVAGYTTWPHTQAAEYRIFLLRRFFRGRHPHLILCSLLHEMVHVYVHQIDRNQADDHGPLFRAACEKLQQLGWSVGTVLNANVRPFVTRDRRAELSNPLGHGIQGFFDFVLQRARSLAARRQRFVPSAEG